MSKGGVAQIVPQGNGLGERPVQTQDRGHGTGNLRDLEDMGETGSIVIPGWGQKNLCFMLKATKGLGMGNPIPIPLKGHTDIALIIFLDPHPPRTVLIETGMGGEDLNLPLLKLLANGSPYNR